MLDNSNIAEPLDPYRLAPNPTAMDLDLLDFHSQHCSCNNSAIHLDQTCAGT